MAPARELSRADHIARMDWGELERSVAACTTCELSTTRTRTVFGTGNRAAEWMLVGEAAGVEEDARG
jgi:DNA polymerase